MTGVRSASPLPGGNVTRSSAGWSQPMRSVPSPSRISCWASPRLESTSVMKAGITFLRPLEVNWANRAGWVASPFQ